MAKNVQGVIFLRNNNPYQTREAARQGIVTNSGSLIDGEFILARYTSDDEVKTLVGVIYVNGDQRNVTIIDMDKASSDVDELRREINAKLGGGVSSANTVTAQLTALSGNSSTDTSATTSVEGAKKYANDLIGTLDYADTAVTGSYVSEVNQADGVISVTREELPTVEAITVAGKPIIAVAEDKGQIAASAGTINAEFVDIADSGEKFTATTVEGALAELDDKIVNVVDGLDYTDTAVTGSYVSKVDEVNGVISVTREELPTVAAISEAGKPITAVSESLGEISATAGTIDAQYVTATGFTATDVQGALEEVKANIGEAISGLDYSDTAVAGEYVSEVNEVDGVISVTHVALPSVTGQSEAKKVVIAVSENKGTVSDTKGTISSSAKTIVLNDNEDGGIDFDVNIDGVTLEKDANGVISVTSSALVQYEGDTKTIAISPVEGGVRTVSTLLTLSSVTPSSTTVKEEYALKNASGETIGSTIKIYKDSSLVSIELVNEDPTQDPPKAGQFLKYTYIDASGATQSVYVDVSALLVEAEFESGVTANDAGVVHGVVDPTSETFLTVGANGFKLAGVQDAIDGAVSGLDASVSAETTHISVKIDEVDGKLTAVTLNEDDIASADDLAQEILDRESGDTALSNRLGDGVTTANTATAQLIALSGDPATAQSGDTSVEGAKKYADAKLDDIVGGLDADKSGSTTHVTVGVVEEDGVITAVTVSESKIADADDLAALSAKTVTALTSTNGSITASIDDATGCKTYDIITDADKIKMSGFTVSGTSSFSGITNDDTIADAFDKANAVITENEIATAEALTDINDKIDALSGASLSGVSVNNVIVPKANNVASIAISSSTDTPSGTVDDPAIIVNTDDSTGAVTLGIGYIDCGTY